ncbi:MAG: hypothetical protein IIB31_01135 [Chloroflexi bacterium]|nr:hypothetical protein [Chloroflexota bacterium]
MHAPRGLIPDCPKTQQGTPTRRAKIQFLLQRSELTTVDIGEFVDEDIQNILELFDVLNSATHGEAGLYDWSTLVTIKRRVEDGLIFLARIAE